MEKEQHGDHSDHYVRISDAVAAQAFVILPSGVSLLNLQWLSEVVWQYEAAARPLADIPTEEERLAHMRDIVQHVDDDHLAAHVRRGMGTEVGGLKTEVGSWESENGQEPRAKGQRLVADSLLQSSNPS
jgi:hypothetical protein